MEWCSRKLSVRFDDIAVQTDSSVWLQYGGTIVLATVVMSEKPKKEDIDFIPLSVHYMEKAYAVRRIPGGFIKREGKNQDHEVLISRLIDRAIRPLINDGLQNEVQVIVTVLSYDPEVGSIIPSFLAASMAMQRSPVPFGGPLAMCQVALIEGEVVVNPSVDQLKKSDGDFIVAGNATKVIMIEGGASELPLKKLSEMIKKGVEAYQPIIEFLKTLPPKTSDKKPMVVKITSDIVRLVLTRENDIRRALLIVIKRERRVALKAILADLIEKNPEVNNLLIRKAFGEVEKNLMLDNIIKTGKRIDGRSLDEVRPIKIEQKILPNLHGSSMFRRGETQVLGALTLGKMEEKQSADELSGFKSYNFMFHYNFLPFCVGETDKIGPPSRREIGHGQIAYRALLPMLPDRLYTYRIVSEVLSSNGSSSMASVCAGSLALMDAGVRIKRHVGGVALGLMKYKNKSMIFVDILGDEDHFGLMDLKICGTEKGITALQMDVSLEAGLPLSLFNQAVKKGYSAVLGIIETMNTAQKYPSLDLPDNLFKIEAIEVDKQRVRQVFGKKAENARDIEKQTESKIEIQDSGRIVISSKNFQNIFMAKKLLREALNDFEPGQAYSAVIYKREDEGIFVKVKDYFIGHLISTRVPKKLKKGDPLKVEYINLDEKGDLMFKVFTAKRRSKIQ